MADLSVVLRLSAVNATGGAIDAVNGALGKMAGIAMTGLVAGVAGVTAGLGLAVHAAGELEQSVANISTIKPEIDTSQVFAELNQISTRVPQTAKQLGDGLYNIFSSLSDLTAEQGLILTETFAKGAVGALTDTQTFGTAAIGVMNAYGLATEDAGHISDVFFNTVKSGNVTGEQLARNLGLVTQSAKMAGVDLNSLGGMIAGVTLQGGDAAQNINNLNNLLLKITTKDAQEAMHGLGIATVDATGNFIPQIDVLSDLRDKTDLMTESGKAAAMQKIFPDLQARAGAAVIMDQLGKVKLFIEENIKSTGSAESAYAKMSATFESQTKLLGNTFKSLLTTLGAEILPTITPIITAFAQGLPGAMRTAREAIGAMASDLREKASGALQGIADRLADTGAAWAPWAEQAGPAGELVASALSGVSTVVQALQLLLQGEFKGAWDTLATSMQSFSGAFEAAGKVFDAVGKAIEENRNTILAVGAALGTFAVLAMIVPPILAFAGAIGGVVAALSAASGAMGVLGVIVALLGGPVTLAIAGVALAVGALVLAWNTNFGDIQGKTKFVVDAITGDFERLGRELPIVGDAVGAFFNRLGTEARILDDASGLTKALTSDMDRLAVEMPIVGAAIGDFFDRLGSELGIVGRATGEFFNRLGTEAQLLGPMFEELVTAIGAFFNRLGTEAQIVAAAVGAAVTAIGGFFNQLGTEAQIVGAAVGAAFSTLGSAIQATVSAIGGFFNQLGTEAQTVVTTVGAAFSSLGSAVQAAMSAIGEAVSTGWAAVTSAVGSAMSAIGSAVRSGWDAISAAVSGALSTIFGAISSWIGQVLGAFQSMGDQLSKAGEQAGRSVVSGLVGAIGAGIGAVGTAARALAQSAINAVTSVIQPGSPSKVFTALGVTIPEGLEAGIKSKNPEVRAAAQELARQAQIGVQVAMPVGAFIVHGEDVGAGIELGILRSVEKVKMAAGTVGDTILDALHGFARDIDTEITKVTDKLADIQTKLDDSIQTAFDKHADALQASIDRAQNSLNSLVVGTNISADSSGRRSALQAQLSDEQKAFTARATAEEAAYQNRLALSQAEAKMHRDLEDAKTSKERESIQARYAEEVANLGRRFTEQQVAVVHREEMEAKARQFKAAQDVQTRALEQALADEAMGRQIADIITLQIAQATAAQQTHDDAVAKAQLTADAQRIILERSFGERIALLKTAFLDKIPELTGPAGEAFNAVMDAISEKITVTGLKIETGFGVIGTAAETVMGQSGVVPEAIEVSDSAVEEFGRQFGVSMADARATLRAGGREAQEVMGIGGKIPTAARQSVSALDSVKVAAGPTLVSTLDNLKNAAIGLGERGFAVAHNAATNLEAKFPGLTAAVDTWIATLGKIPPKINTDVTANFVTTGTQVVAGASGGGGGGGGGSSGANNQYAGQGSAGSYTLPNIVTGGSITVQGSNLSNAIAAAAQQTGVSASAQAAGGTFGGNTNPSLRFAEGGMVPGPYGSPQIATVHGGEMVLTPEQWGRGGSSGSRDLTVNVNVQGSLVGMTARKLAEEIRTQLIQIARSNGGPDRLFR